MLRHFKAAPALAYPPLPFLPGKEKTGLTNHPNCSCFFKFSRSLRSLRALRLIFLYLIHREKRGMIGCEKRGIAAEDPGNSGMSFEFTIQKLPDFISIPPQGMLELPIKGQIPFIEILGFHLLRVRTADG